MPLLILHIIQPPLTWLEELKVPTVYGCSSKTSMGEKAHSHEQARLQVKVRRAKGRVGGLR